MYAQQVYLAADLVLIRTRNCLEMAEVKVTLVVGWIESDAEHSVVEAIFLLVSDSCWRYLQPIRELHSQTHTGKVWAGREEHHGRKTTDRGTHVRVPRAA